MSKDGAEITCFVVTAKGAALDQAAAELTEILKGKREPSKTMSYARWAYGGGSGTHEIGFRLPELVELPWEAQDDDDPAAQIWVIEAKRVAAAKKQLAALVRDRAELAARVAELTEEDVDARDVAAIDLDEDDETDSGRLFALVKRLTLALDRAATTGGMVLFGLAC
jgi:hypothetical protein